MPFLAKDGVYDENPMPHRVRHITSVQVRNLTPFPVRDAFTSALSQPSAQSQFNPDGRLSDDLDATFGRKRGRRLSAASVSALRATHPDIDNPHPESTRRLPQSTRGTSVGRSIPSPRKRPAGTAPSTRPFQRARRVSTNSSSGFSDTSAHTNIISTTVSNSSFLWDASQLALEQVLDSRLVETCLTLSIPSSHPDHPDAEKRSAFPMSSSGPARAPSHQSSFSLGKASPSQPDHPRHLENANVKVLRGQRSGGGSSTSRSSTPTGSGPSTSKRSSTPPSRTSSVSHNKSSSVSNASSTTLSARNPRGSSLGVSSSSRTHLPNPPSPEPSSKAPRSHRLPIHRPSTNPCFNIDVRNDLKGVLGDLSGEFIRVELLGNVRSGFFTKGGEPDHSRSVPSPVKKGKMKEVDPLSEEVKQWKGLERWDVNLKELVPLPKELASHPSLLPSNTLLITLSPPGQTYYLPSHLSNINPLQPNSRPSRPPSPSVGYSSDPETSVRRVQSQEELSLGSTDPAHKECDDPPPQQTGDGQFGVSRYPEKPSATSHDLLRLVTQQTIVVETQDSLADVISSVDHLFTYDLPTIAAREVSERKAAVRQLEAEKGIVEDEAQNLRNQIDARREALKHRKQLLAHARMLHEEDVQEMFDLDQGIGEDTESLECLRNRFAPTRSALLGILASIYPIELLSPPDLLFTIVDVPLPIPVPPTDPAPPLSLPGWNSVTEEAVATALGYAARLVHTTAVYMNVGLTYPITCIESRSLIKDGISAMVGPRMFPLYSKGVDTYRFEYAVFLLNKDIELLMASRDLRALDMRHTLPNLKNLLLTLTDPESPPVPLHPPSLVLSDTDSVLRSPATSLSTLATDASVTDGEESDTSAVGEASDTHEVASNVDLTTPTQASTVSTPRKSRAFFGLAPLSGFLRSRYPSASKADALAEPPEAVVPVGSAEAASSSGGDLHDVEASPTSGDEEDDRKTIRPSPEGGSPTEDKDVADPSPTRTPHANGLTPPAAQAEKPIGSGVGVTKVVPLTPEAVS